MPSRPASQLADDGEAVGTPVPPAYDPSSAEPLATRDGARKSVAPPPIGREANVVPQRSPPAVESAADHDHPAPPAHAGGLPAAFAPRQAAGGPLHIATATAAGGGAETAPKAHGSALAPTAGAGPSYGPVPASPIWAAFETPLRNFGRVVTRILAPTTAPSSTSATPASARPQLPAPPGSELGQTHPPLVPPGHARVGVPAVRP